MAGQVLEGADLISANTFARHSSIWTQVIPAMEPMVRWINTHQASLGRAVDSLSGNERNSLIAEAAFLLASSGFSYTPGFPSMVETQARRFLRQLPGGQAAEAMITSEEWDEIGRLARV